MAKDPIIDTRIPLTTAMGVGKTDTPEQISKKWVAWKTKFPAEVPKLSPAIPILLDTLEIVINVYTILVTAVKTVEDAVVAAGKAYNLALSLLPGVGAAGAAKDIAEEALNALKKQTGEIATKIYKIPPTVYDQLTNSKVSEKSVL